MRTGIRLILCLQCIALLLCVANAAWVTGEKITAETGQKIEIPVTITENAGIMGFRITVAYPPELLSEPKVRAGSLTETGLLDSRVSQDGYIEVLWCASSDATGDGSLFVLEFTVQEGMEGVSGELLFSYSQEDTFNEKWEDVSLQFSPALVKVTGSPVATTEGTQATATDSTEPNPSETTTDALTEDLTTTELPSAEGIAEPEESFAQVFVGSTELSTVLSEKQERADWPVVPIALIAVVIFGSMFGIYWMRRRK